MKIVMHILLISSLLFFASPLFAQENFFDLDNAEIEVTAEAVVEEVPAVYAVGGPIALLFFFIMILLIGKWLFPYRKSPLKFNIQTFPVGVKRGLAMGLGIYGIAFVLGMVDIIYQTTIINESTKEYFENFGVARMVGFTHAHLFGLTTSFLIIGIPFSMQFGHSRFYQWMLPIGLSSAVTDIVSWWGIKYFGESFELISMIMGILFSVSYLFMLIALLRVLLFPHYLFKIGKHIF